MGISNKHCKFERNQAINFKWQTAEVFKFFNSIDMCVKLSKP